jgi:hypothetical protein
MDDQSEFAEAGRYARKWRFNVLSPHGSVHSFRAQSGVRCGPQGTEKRSEAARFQRDIEALESGC